MSKKLETKTRILAYPDEKELELNQLKTDICVSVEKTKDSPHDWISVTYNGYEIVLPRVNWNLLEKQVKETLNEFDKK